MMSKFATVTTVSPFLESCVHLDKAEAKKD